MNKFKERINGDIKSIEIIENFLYNEDEKNSENIKKYNFLLKRERKNLIDNIIDMLKNRALDGEFIKTFGEPYIEDLTVTFEYSYMEEDTKKFFEFIYESGMYLHTRHTVNEFDISSDFYNINIMFRSHSIVFTFPSKNILDMFIEGIKG